VSTSAQTVELIATKEIDLFLPIMKDLANDFGDRFLLSMLHWCEIGRRSTSLDYWEVFLLRSAGEVVGVSGLYRQPGMPRTVCWVGWFGVRPPFRRRGYGSAAIHALAKHARTMDCKELWVYTGSSDSSRKKLLHQARF
jgi:RimJ/RimL family protein N-acetyltransferase